MAEKEGRGFLETYKKASTVTLKGAVSIAAFSAFFAPPLVMPALTLAGIELAQILGASYFQSVQKEASSKK